MRLASPSDFYNGPIYTYYRHHEGYAKRAELLREFPDPILVVGCGFGFLVEELLKIGKDAYGIDESLWAMAYVPDGIGRRIWRRNILDAEQVRDIPLRLPPLGTVVTEDLLPCLTDEETRIAAEHCATLAPSTIHLVTEQGQAQELNYHSLSEWSKLTNQLTISLEGM